MRDRIIIEIRHLEMKLGSKWMWNSNFCYWIQNTLLNLVKNKMLNEIQ